MKYDYNYHTHCKYCKHGYGELKEYVSDALKIGLKQLGFTCHIPFEPSFVEGGLYNELKWIAIKEGYLKIPEGRESRMDHSDISSYLNDIQKCKNEYNDISIYSGFECEYDDTNVEFIKQIRNEVDYLNLGIHHVFANEQLYDFTKRYVVSKFGVRPLVYDDFDVYLESCIKGMKSGLFSILVHPDFFMEKVEVFNEKCEEISRKIIEAAIKYDVYVELNTSDFFKADKKKRRVMYPRDEFWKIASEYKELKIVIGTDAHTPNRVGDFQYEHINEIIRKYNLTVVQNLMIK